MHPRLSQLKDDRPGYISSIWGMIRDLTAIAIAAAAIGKRGATEDGSI